MFAFKFNPWEVPSGEVEQRKRIPFASLLACSPLLLLLWEQGKALGSGILFN